VLFEEGQCVYKFDSLHAAVCCTLKPNKHSDCMGVPECTNLALISILLPKKERCRRSRCYTFTHDYCFKEKLEHRRQSLPIILIHQQLIKQVCPSKLLQCPSFMTKFRPMANAAF
jgi:hypothetical protein